MRWAICKDDGGKLYYCGYSDGEEEMWSYDGGDAAEFSSMQNANMVMGCLKSDGMYLEDMELSEEITPHFLLSITISTII